MTDSNVREGNPDNMNAPKKSVLRGNKCPGFGCATILTDEGIDRCPDCAQALIWPVKFKKIFTWGSKRYSIDNDNAVIVLTNGEILKNDQKPTGINQFETGTLSFMGFFMPGELCSIEEFASTIGAAYATPIVLPVRPMEK